jgi:hypothetical protein
MNIEFHYYAIYILAREAGMDEGFSATMAYASQYVDAATRPLSFDAPRGRVDIRPTQNYLFWDEGVRREIYLPFHFLPGDPAAAAALRADGAQNRYAVTPNGDIVKSLLIGALKDKDPYRIGIALHSFADSWAHQNFSGLMEDFNALAQAKGKALPPAGHLQALALPDSPDGVWRDDRLKEPHAYIVNRDRFALAARKIYRYLRVYLGKPFADDELIVERLARIWADPSREGRLADYAIEYGVEPWDAEAWRREAGAPADDSPLAGLRHYDKLAWAKAELTRAFSHEAPAIPVGGAFYASRLYRWNEAAMEHKKRALAALEREGL